MSFLSSSCQDCKLTFQRQRKKTTACRSADLEKACSVTHFYVLTFSPCGALFPCHFNKFRFGVFLFLFLVIVFRLLSFQPSLCRSFLGENTRPAKWPGWNRYVECIIRKLSSLLNNAHERRTHHWDLHSGDFQQFFTCLLSVVNTISSSMHSAELFVYSHLVLLFHAHIHTSVLSTLFCQAQQMFKETRTSTS